MANKQIAQDNACTERREVTEKLQYKQQGKKGFFDEQFNGEKLSEIGNPLARISQVVDFEMFRATLEKKLKNEKKKNNAGAKPYDYVLMFKILLLQRFHNLSDKQTEFQIIDRQSFKEFLGLSSGDKVPDSNTIREFREKIANLGLEEQLFYEFNEHLEKIGLMVNAGQIVDASFVECPRQRNSKAENEQIKAGNGAELWKDEQHKKSQKDIDARWTKKNKENHYGYKNHAKVDAKSKLINTYTVTDASVHDSQATKQLLRKSDKKQTLHADSAYKGEKYDKMLKNKGIKNRIHEKGYKGKPLTDKQKAANKAKSKVRVRVEHVFGFMEYCMNKLYIRCIGMKRAQSVIGLTNLTYNIFRYEQIVRLDLLPIKKC